MLVVPRSADFYPRGLPNPIPYPSPDLSPPGRANRHERHHSLSNHTAYQKRPQPPPPCLLERLPNELQHMVYAQLDYQALIHLSTMNHYFHKTIDPQRMAHPLDKAALVMRAAKDFPQHRPSERGHEFRPGNFECYICFRVRAPEVFDAYQPQSAYVDTYGRFLRDSEADPRRDKKVFLRRFCIECGIKEGLHAPFDCLTTKAGVDLWVCRCRRVWSKPNHMKCRDCGADCPLRPRKK